MKVAKTDNTLAIYLGTDLARFDAAAINAKKTKNQGELWIGYAGTLGASYNLDVVIKALKILLEKTNYNMRLKVMGDGPDLERLKELGKDLPIDFLGRLQYQDMVGVLSQCDLAVNPIVHNAAQSIINKHGDYAAAGLPVVSTQESNEYRDLIVSYNCGITCGVDDYREVAHALEKILSDRELRIKMSRNSRVLAEERFDRAVTYQKLVVSIEEAIRK